MKAALFLFITFGSSALLADSVVCTSGGYPGGTVIPCSSSPLDIVAQLPTEKISGNTLTIQYQFSFGLSNATLPPLAVTVTGTVNDKYTLPSSPAGDVWKVFGRYGAGGVGEPGSSSTQNLQIGPGSATDPEIVLNPFIQPPANCPPGKSISCTLTTTLPTSAFSFFSFQGSATLVAVSGSSPTIGEVSSLIFQFSRFKADGTTPDPMSVSPEPGSIALAGLGALMLIGMAWRPGKRRNA